MKLILIVDVETSGFDPEKDHLVEAAVLLWDVPHRTTLHQASWIVRAPSNAAQNINHIPAGLLVDGRDRELVNKTVAAWAANADAIVAHNADFDTKWLPPFDKPIVDSAWDIAWPMATDNRQLHALCLAHGLAVFEAHRALPDCQLLARLLERCAELGQDVGELLRRAMRPKTKVYSLAPFEMKDVVKAHSFRWAPEPEKVWWRMVATEDLDQFLASLPFPCTTEAPAARKRWAR